MSEVNNSPERYETPGIVTILARIGAIEIEDWENSPHQTETRADPTYFMVNYAAQNGFLVEDVLSALRLVRTATASDHEITVGTRCENEQVQVLLDQWLILTQELPLSNDVQEKETLRQRKRWSKEVTLNFLIEMGLSAKSLDTGDSFTIGLLKELIGKSANLVLSVGTVYEFERTLRACKSIIPRHRQDNVEYGEIYQSISSHLNDVNAGDIEKLVQMISRFSGLSVLQITSFWLVQLGIPYMYETVGPRAAEYCSQHAEVILLAEIGALIAMLLAKGVIDRRLYMKDRVSNDLFHSIMALIFCQGKPTKAALLGAIWDITLRYGVQDVPAYAGALAHGSLTNSSIGILSSMAGNITSVVEGILASIMRLHSLNKRKVN